jgi:hypothetical protein
MIQYTKAGDGLRMGLFVHHTDANDWKQIFPEK